MATVTNETLLLILAIITNIVGVLWALSNIRVMVSERLTRVETHMIHIAQAVGVKIRKEDLPHGPSQ